MSLAHPQWKKIHQSAVRVVYLVPEDLVSRQINGVAGSLGCADDLLTQMLMVSFGVLQEDAVSS